MGSNDIVLCCASSGELVNAINSLLQAVSYVHALQLPLYLACFYCPGSLLPLSLVHGGLIERRKREEGQR